LLIPNVFTGYIFLLDKDNHVRWIGTGETSQEEFGYLKTAVYQLYQEQNGSLAPSGKSQGKDKKRK
jgi:hypothetical protein